MVTSSVAEDLTAAGFSCGDGIAYTIENDDYAAAGLYYYDSGLQLFESSELQSVGFVQIVSDTVKYEEPSSAQSVITVVPSDDSIVKHLICTYSYENIVSDHFVYQGYYVSYYQQSPMRVVYSITENITSNYDFTLGSLYPNDQVLLICDGAPWHKSKTLSVPDNIHLQFIPPYTPEMNPIEQIWREIRTDGFRNEVFQTLGKVVDRLCNTICSLTKDTIKRITRRKWIFDIFNED